MKLEQVVTTHLLQERSSGMTAGHSGIAESAGPLPHHICDPVDICHELARRMLLLCPSAGSAGITTFFDTPSDTMTWSIVEGECAPYEGGRFPRKHSMCGVCFERRGLQMFSQPHLYFKWMERVGIRVEEAIVCPIFGTRDEIYGTFWAFSHDPSAAPFTPSDARVLSQLAALTRQASSISSL